LSLHHNDLQDNLKLNSISASQLFRRLKEMSSGRTPLPLSGRRIRRSFPRPSAYRRSGWPGIRALSNNRSFLWSRTEKHVYIGVDNSSAHLGYQAATGEVDLTADEVTADEATLRRISLFRNMAKNSRKISIKNRNILKFTHAWRKDYERQQKRAQAKIT